MTTNAWRIEAAKYHTHHFSCPTCRASGSSNNTRCELGQSLWDAYQTAWAECVQTMQNPFAVLA